MSIVHFGFIAVAFFAIYVQSKSYAFAGSRKAGDPADPAGEYEELLRIRRVMSPSIAGLAAVLVGLGTFVFRSGPLLPGALLTGVWVFAALGDIFIEGSYSTEDQNRKARYYIIGMVLFIVFTLGLGVGLVLNALLSFDIPPLYLGGAVLASLACGTLAYRTLEVSPENLGIVLVYTVSVTVLLCGGLLSALGGDVHLGYIGIAYFISDWCVGLRDFGKKTPALFQRHVLIVILILYYTIMLTSIDYALGG